MFITNDLDIFPFFSISAVLHQLRISREVMQRSYLSSFIASKPPLDLPPFTFSKRVPPKKFWKKGRHYRARFTLPPKAY